MKVTLAIARRELAAYFATPLAYVFIIAFLVAAAAATFAFGGFMDRRQADLTPFFDFHPWLFVILIPAVSMRLWAEERRSGTIELLLTLPVTPWEAVTGKFLAAWAFIGLNLLLTVPIWITVNYLGDPDNGVIVASYIGSFLMAGALLAAASCASALSSNQVIAFVYGITICFLLLATGFDFVLNQFSGWASPTFVDLLASFSFLTHFGNIARGVLDLGAIVFFALLTLLFLFINRQVVEVGSDRTAATIALSLGLFLALNSVSAMLFQGVRIDLSEGGIYTVSPSSRAVLANVDEPITIRVFLSSAFINEAAEVRIYADRVNELLARYQQYSDGMVQVEWIDPKPFSAEEDDAIGYGLVGFNLSRAGEQGYFGIVATNTVDQIEVMPVLAPTREAYLEYDLTRLVLRLSRPDEPRVAVFDGLGLFGMESLGRRPSATIERLGDDFDLVQLANDTTIIPDGIDALIIIHPHSLTDSALYAIDQYAIRGGPTLVFLDPLSENSPRDPSNQSRPLDPESYLDRLMASWGAVMVPASVVGDREMALEVRAQAGPQVVISDYPPWLVVQPAHLNPDDVVTAQLSLMRIASGGALRAVDGVSTTFTPLIRTTTESMLYDQALIMQQFDPATLVRTFVPSGANQVLAARLSGGPVSTAFPDGAPPPPAVEAGDPAPPAPPQHVARSEGSISVIVVADTDILTDPLNVTAEGTPTTQNTDFLVNAVDTLVGGGELITLRSRGLSYRPFIRLDSLERAAEERYRATEQELQAELEEIQRQLDELQMATVTADMPLGALTRQQQQAADEYNDRLVDIRKALREVRSALREQINSLGSRLQLINILAAPLIIGLIGVGVALWRRARLARYLRGLRVAAG